MRSPFAIFIIICSFFTAHADNYVAVHVRGKILINDNQAVLKMGDKFTDEDKVVFSSANAMAVVMSSSRGRLILKNEKSEETSEISYLVASIVSPTKGQLSTRSGKILNYVDLKNHISQESFVILDTTRIQISNNLYLLDEKHFFFLTYNYNNELINKKLNQDGQEILFDRMICAIDGKPINAEDINSARLFYYNAEEKVKLEIGSMNLVFIDSIMLKKQLQFLIDVNDQPIDLQSSSWVTEFQGFISDSYGFVSKESVQNWINKNY